MAEDILHFHKLKKQFSELEASHNEMDELIISHIEDLEKILLNYENENMKITRTDVLELCQLTEIRSNHKIKTFHSELSKISKIIHKTFSIDVDGLFTSVELDKTALNRLVLQYLYAKGEFDVASIFAKEAAIEDTMLHIKNSYVDIYENMKLLKEKDVRKVTIWIENFKSNNQNLRRGILFELHRANVICKIKAGRSKMHCLEYMKYHMQEFMVSHKNESFELIGCIMSYGYDLNKNLGEAYLLTDDSWYSFITRFFSYACALLAIPSESYLETCMKAGMIGLPSLCKMTEMFKLKGTAWKELTELPLEIPMDQIPHFHDIVCCPVSREPTAPGNPPVLLRCGHVMCQTCIKNLPRLRDSSSRVKNKFKCPTCPEEQSIDDVLVLRF